MRSSLIIHKSSIRVDLWQLERVLKNKLTRKKILIGTPETLDAYVSEIAIYTI